MGLRSPGEEVPANFGQTAFVFDIEAERAEVKRGILAEIGGTSIPDADWPGILNKLVTQYLVHHGYADTAAALARDTECSINEDRESMLERRRLYDAVMGKIRLSI